MKFVDDATPIFLLVLWIGGWPFVSYFVARELGRSHVLHGEDAMLAGAAGFLWPIWLPFFLVGWVVVETMRFNDDWERDRRDRARHHE